MSKVVQLFKYLIATLAIFFAFLFYQNGKFLIVNISIPSGDSLKPIIYYTTSSKESFIEKRVLHPKKIENNSYYFDISKIKNLQSIRFDPEVHKDLNMTIYKIWVKKLTWFQKAIYKVPLSFVKAKSGVEVIKRTNKFNFLTKNRDPQLIIEPRFIFEQRIFYLYLDKLILSFIIALILIYLWNISNKEIDNKLEAKLILYSIFLFFIIFKAFYYKDNVHYGYPPDERAHMSYIQYVNTHHSLITNFKELPNYLSHPPLYYELENLVFDKTQDMHKNVSNFRTLSVAIFALSIIFLLYLGFSANFSILGDFVFLSLTASLPMLSYIGGSISNDNLALLGASIFLIGFKRFFEKRIDNITFLLISLGGAIAYFSKLTAALLIFFAIIYYLLFFARREFFSKIKLTHIAILIVFLTPIIYYQATIMLEYHSLVPTYNVTHPKEFLNSNFYTPPEHRIHLNAKEWFFRLVHFIHSGWFAIHSHHSFGHSSWAGVFGLVALHIFAIVALFLRCNSKQICYFGKIVLIGLFSVELVQYIFSYKAHIANGYMGGLQPRYLLPFMVGFAIMASIFVEKFKKYFWWNILVIAICIQAIYSDFFYFLLYYK